MRKWMSLLLIGCLILCACSSKQAKYQEKYDLGVKYLSEGNYEEAVIAFTAAIEIDAKQAAAYVGRGDSYMGLAGQASDAAQREAYCDNAAADYQMAADLGDETGTEKLQQVQLVMSSQEFLRTLYATFAAGDLEQAQELMTQETYRQLAGSIKEGHLYYGESNEYGLAIYPNAYCYFGQWKDGERSGEGTWTYSYRWPEEEGNVYAAWSYQGEWTNDKPNGSGLSKGKRIDNSLNRYYETKGNYVNGKAEGVIQSTQEEWGDSIWDQRQSQSEVYYINGIANGKYHNISHDYGIQPGPGLGGRPETTEIWAEFKDGYPYGTMQYKITADGDIIQESEWEAAGYFSGGPWTCFIGGLDDTENEQSTTNTVLLSRNEKGMHKEA